ncbi:MAG TPA: hypothetical protein VF755_02455 [Catenuloplanes sp.]
METNVDSVLVDLSQAAAIWLGLLVVAVSALALLSAPGMRRRPGAAADPGRPTTTREQEARRYAEEVAVAAGRAAVTARRRRLEWLATHDAVEAAWQAFDAIDNEARRLAAAAIFPLPRTARTPAEFADRERYLHRAATAACRRRELSVRQLSDALGHRNGWDPRRHPVEQQVVLCRVSRDHLLGAYRTVSAAERAAWHAAEVAAVAAASLREEALAAAVRAAGLEPLTAADRSALAWRGAPTARRRPRLATR